MTYTHKDVKTHYGSDRPAVNVKVHGSIRDADVWETFRRDEDPDAGFTMEWVDANVSEDVLDRCFWDQCENERDYLERWANGEDGDPIFPDDSIRFEVDGRSGGWLVVRGLPDISEWDAVRLARWRRFERIATDTADGVPLQMLSGLYINEWEWARDEREERERAANQDIATVAA